MKTRHLPALVLVALAVLLTACAAPKITMNTGETVVAEWNINEAKEDVQEAATASCREAGKKSAREVSIVAMYPANSAWSLMPIMLTKLITYQCSMDPPVITTSRTYHPTSPTQTR